MHCSRPARILIHAAILAAVSSAPSRAFASPVDGFALCTAANDQLNPVSASDGAGGAIFAWHDSRPTVPAGGVCFVQRVDATGVPQWGADGVALSTTGDPGVPVISSDGAGGAFVAFGGASSQPRAQWVNAAGALQWGADGVALSVTASAKEDVAIAPDVNGAGGAIIAWREVSGVAGTSDVYAQKVSAAGAIQWGTSGVVVAGTNMHSERLPALITDGAGGAIVVYVHGATGARIQRLNASGVAQWGNVSLSSMANNNVPVIVSDGAGGVVTAWAGGGVYAQRVSSTGARLWGGLGGVTLATTGTHPAMIAQAGGGAIVTWQDFRSGTNFNIYAQRVDGAGTTQWMLNGAEVCFETDDQISPSIVSDGGTGAIISWSDSRSGPSGADIYAQRINSGGVSQWAPNGVPLCSAANNQEFPTAVSDGDGGAFIAWQDLRSGTNEDIYALRVNPDGLVVAVPPGNGVASKVRVLPNPSFDRVQIAFTLPAATRASLEIFDIHGREVRRFGTELLPAGDQVLTWDGRTSDGHRVEAGIYFLRVGGDGIAFARSVVRLR